MIRPATRDIKTLRHQPLDYEILFKGLDLSASVFKMQIRPALESAVLRVDLVNAAPGAQGISASTIVIGGILHTSIKIHISKATAEGFPAPVPAGALQWIDRYDFKIDGLVYQRGKFIVEGGVTV